MPLNPSEKERTRYALGYPETAPAASLQMGIPRPIQTAFLLEAAMDYLIEPACNRVRQILNILDGIETKMVDAQDRLAAVALGGLKLRENEPDMLELEYHRWAGRLADIFGVPLYPFSTKNRSAGNGAANIPVRNGG